MVFSYEDIKQQLRVCNYKIGNRKCFDYKEFIEAVHEIAPEKGRAFYNELMKVMPTVGEKVDDGYLAARFKEVLIYCADMIKEIEESKNEEITLLNLSEKNGLYEYLINTYNQKIAIAFKFLGQKDFIESEIARIKTLYLNPSKMTVAIEGGEAKVLGNFIYDEYSNMAFGYLVCGENMKISEIITHAESKFSTAFKHAPEVIKHTVGSNQFKNDITHQLKYGVAQLLYYKFLKQQLDSLINTNISPIYEPFADKCKMSLSTDINKIDLTIEGQFDGSENDFLHSTTEDYLFEFKSAFNNDADYKKTFEAVYDFFVKEQTKTVINVFIKNGYSKPFAFALGEIYRSQKNSPISYDYIKFIRDSFSIYQHLDIDNKALNKISLYKYLTTKT